MLWYALKQKKAVFNQVVLTTRSTERNQAKRPFQLVTLPYKNANRLADPGSYGRSSMPIILAAPVSLLKQFQVPPIRNILETSSLVVSCTVNRTPHRITLLQSKTFGLDLRLQALRVKALLESVHRVMLVDLARQDRLPCRLWLLRLLLVRLFVVALENRLEL